MWGQGPRFDPGGGQKGQIILSVEEFVSFTGARSFPSLAENGDSSLVQNQSRIVQNITTIYVFINVVV